MTNTDRKFSTHLSDIELKENNTVKASYFASGQDGTLVTKETSFEVSKETYEQITQLKAAFGEKDSLFVRVAFDSKRLTKTSIDTGNVGGDALQKKWDKAGVASQFSSSPLPAEEGYNGATAFESQEIQRFIDTAVKANHAGVTGFLSNLVRAGKRKVTEPDGTQSGIAN